MLSKEGLLYNPATGLSEGLPCSGVVQPPRFDCTTQQSYDVIVIGAGYSGLIAGRELALRGTFIGHLEFHCILIYNQVIELFCWKHEIESVAEHGLLRLMDTITRWAALGYTGASLTYGQSSPDIVCLTSCWTLKTCNRA
jgi:hypothetical protein